MVSQIAKLAAQHAAQAGVHLINHLLSPQKKSCDGRFFCIIEDSWSWLKELFFQTIAKLIEWLESIKQKLTTSSKHNFEIATLYGCGIKNGGNSCYINAVVQALRFTSLPQLLASRTQSSNDETKAFLKLITTLEGQEGQPGRIVGVGQINNFRNLMIHHGFRANKTTQEDASQFCQFLFDHIGFQPIYQKAQVFHEMRITVPSLDRGKVFENHIQLSLGNAQSDTELKDLALCNIITEEIETEKIISQREINQTAECQKALKELKPIELIPTLQSIHLEEGKIPSLLPIFIKRFEYDKEHEQMAKVQTRILPSKVIDFPLTDHPTKKARFVLCSIVIHSGKSVKKGHYYTYVPKLLEGHDAYLEYDDSTVRVRRNSKTVVDDIAENGYLYFYRHEP